MTPLNLGVLILAAGGSLRLGSPKQLLPWHGETLLAKAVREVAEISSPMVQISRIAVVLGANYEAVFSGLQGTFPAADGAPFKGVRSRKSPFEGGNVSEGNEGDGFPRKTPPELTLLRNDAWQTGLASSIACGMSALGGADASLIWLCDQPLVTSLQLIFFAESYVRSGKGIAASRYHDSAGVPAIFGRKYFAELQSLSGDRGAKSLFHLHAGDVAMFDCPEAGFDIDTAEDYHRALAQLP